MTIAVSSLPTVGLLAETVLHSRLRGPGLGVRVGPFDICIHAEVSGLAAPLRQLYGDYTLLEAGQDFSFHVRLVDAPRSLPWRPRRVRFLVDGRAPHEDMPRDQALAVLEWGINLVVALRYHCFLMLHAAVVERNGQALVLPAAPGSGKTTLCAALVHRGWRLLSDEFGLVRPGTIELLPLPRLMPLKNESIEVLRAFAPQAELGPLIRGTRKGDIRHLRPPTESVQRGHETARIRWIVFPRWARGVGLSMLPLMRTEGFMGVASNAFNYEMLGHAGFATVRELVDASECLQLEYSDLGEAVAALTALADQHAG